MTYAKKFRYTLLNSGIGEGNLDPVSKILSWALLNFQLQSFLYQEGGSEPENVTEELQEIGYKGTSIKELNEKDFANLFEKESFFSASQTGKRIASFALQENGLQQNRFQEIEDSITNAYRSVKKLDYENILLEQSYRHCMDTLSVFKL